MSPLFWILVLVLLALLTKIPNRKKYYTIAAFVLLLLFSNEFLFNEVIKKWETSPTPIENVDTYDYVILLGGFSEFDTTYHKIKFTESADRFCQALYLYQQKKAKKILISGGSGSLLNQNKTEADKVKTFLLSLNVPDKDVIMEMTSRNTHENAVNTAEYIKKHSPGARCIMVTSAWHMPRALSCFKKSGLNVTAYSADCFSQPRNYSVDFLILPNAKVLSRWNLLIKEWIGYFAYKVSGYL